MHKSGVLFWRAQFGILEYLGRVVLVLLLGYWDARKLARDLIHNDTSLGL